VGPTFLTHVVYTEPAGRVRFTRTCRVYVMIIIVLVY